MTNNLSPSMQQQATSAVDPMEWLFAQLHGKYGTAFTGKYSSGVMVDGKDTGLENTKAVWREDFRAAGLRSLGDLRRGLAACGKFVPTGPEFIDFCRAVPNVDAAMQEAVAQLHARNSGKDVWSHPAVFWAAQSVGYHDMTTLSASALRPRFAAALDQVLRQADIKPVPPMARPEYRLEQAPVSAEKVNDAKKAIGQYLHEMLKPSGAPADGLRWAKRIMERAKAGGNVSLYQLREAEQALAAGSDPA
ncbi:replication protein P [Herbaspirillum seropedicae]|uniref:replication protein P n=1 Tax=Herbaspirillum seropedicae TaxID=964 RepID=UPI003FCEBA5A